jgi:hypothetical protein
MRLCLVFSLFCCSAFAGSVTISASGTWGTLSGTNTYFVSNEPWTLSFQVVNPPSSTYAVYPTSFGTYYTNGVYTLNGNPVTLTGTQVYFSTSYSFDFCLDSGCNNQIGTFNGDPSLFSGTTSNPTLVPGSYPTTSSGFAADSFSLNFEAPYQGSTGTQGTISVSGATTPEPASALLIVTGLGFVAFLRRRN